MSGSDLLEHMVWSSLMRSVSSSEQRDRPTATPSLSLQEHTHIIIDKHCHLLVVQTYAHIKNTPCMIDICHWVSAGIAQRFYMIRIKEHRLFWEFLPMVACYCSRTAYTAKSKSSVTPHLLLKSSQSSSQRRGFLSSLDWYWLVSKRHYPFLFCHLSCRQSQWWKEGNILPGTLVRTCQSLTIQREKETVSTNNDYTERFNGWWLLWMLLGKVAQLFFCKIS